MLFRSEEMNDYIAERYRELAKDPKVSFHLKPNNNIMKSEMISSVDDIDLTSYRSIAPILGFEKKIYKAMVKHQSTLPVDIMDVDDIRIQVSCATGSFDGSKPSNTVYEFFPEVPPGFKIKERPSPIIYYPLTTNILSEITVRIIDQDNRLINFRGERITVRLVFHLE